MSELQPYEPHQPAQPPRSQVRVIMAAVLLLVLAVAIWGFAWVRGQWGGDDAGPPATVTVTSTASTPRSTGSPTPSVQTATPVPGTATGATATGATTTAATTTRPTATTTRPSVTLPRGARVCDGSAEVRAAAGSAKTSCAFAQSVRSAWVAAGKGDRSVRARSPVTDKDYTMTCSGTPVTTCRGGDDAVVYLY